jgi:hypothetical protein
MKLKEWMFGPNAEQQKKTELEEKIRSRQAWLDQLTMNRGMGAEQRDMRDPEDARIIDRLTDELAALRSELEKLEQPKP